MSEELKDDKASAVPDGEIGRFVIDPRRGLCGAITEEMLNKKNHEYWRIGAKACKADFVALLADTISDVFDGTEWKMNKELMKTTGVKLFERLREAYAAGLASAEKRIAELEDSLNVIDKDRESYYAPVIAEKDRRIAELEKKLQRCVDRENERENPTSRVGQLEKEAIERAYREDYEAWRSS